MYTLATMPPPNDEILIWARSEPAAFDRLAELGLTPVGNPVLELRPPTVRGLPFRFELAESNLAELVADVSAETERLLAVLDDVAEFGCTGMPTAPGT